MHERCRRDAGGMERREEVRGREIFINKLYRHQKEEKENTR
jgi:hypothetical protein